MSLRLSFDGARRPGNVTRVLEPERFERRHFAGGYFYPLDVRAALDLHTAEAYVARCAERAQRQPDSARNSASRRARALWERQRKSEAEVREARARAPRGIR